MEIDNWPDIDWVEVERTGGEKSMKELWAKLVGLFKRVKTEVEVKTEELSGKLEDKFNKDKTDDE